MAVIASPSPRADKASIQASTYGEYAEALTSIGERNVTVRFIGPAMMAKMDRVGVIWMLVTVPGVSGLPFGVPIHEYVLPSIRILPLHPRTDCIHRHRYVAANMVTRRKHTDEFDTNVGIRLDNGSLPAVLCSHALIYGERTASGILAGKKARETWA